MKRLVLPFLNDIKPLFTLTQWSRVLLEKLTDSESRNSLHFMEPESTLPHSQVPATSPYPGPDRSSPCPHIPFASARYLSLSWARSIQSVPTHPISWRSILTLPSHLRLGLPSSPFLFYFTFYPLHSFFFIYWSYVDKTTLQYDIRHVIVTVELGHYCGQD